jgi:hypothetical protein
VISTLYTAHMDKNSHVRMFASMPHFHILSNFVFSATILSRVEVSPRGEWPSLP